MTFMKTKQILAFILAVILGISIVPLDAKAEDTEAYRPNEDQEIGVDTDRGLLDDADTTYSIIEGGAHVKVWNEMSLYLERDSYVEFKDDKGAFWTLDKAYSEAMRLPQRLFLKKGYHSMLYRYTIFSDGDSSSSFYESSYLTYKIYPICGIYYPSGNGYEKFDSYALQSHSEKKSVPEKSFRGYNFGGWYEDEGLTIPFTSVDMSIGKDWYVYPKLTPIVYTITYEMDGGVNNPENPDGYTIEDKKITLQPPTKEGYKFSRWYMRSGERKVTVSEIDASDLKNVKVFAEWAEKEYSITYENVDKHTNPSIYKASDGTITLSSPSKRKGYEFEGWYLDAACTQPVTEIDCSIKKDITIYAKWNPISYRIIYNLNGGTKNTDDPDGYTIEDEKIVLQPPVKDGAEFEGWFTDPAFKKRIIEINPADCMDIKLYAKWKKRSSDMDITPTLSPSVTPTPTMSPTVTIDPSDEEYKILRGSKVLEREEGKRRFDLGYLPTDGKIIFTKGLEDGNPLFYLDSEENHLTGGEDKTVSELSGHISKGRHYIYLSYTHPISCGLITTVSYVFYPKCRVYCVYNDQTTEIASYYLKGSHSTLTLKAPDIKGCRVLGLYADRELTVPVDSVSMGIGKDWYVYPKVEPLTYTITYDLDGGVNHSENKTTYTIEDEDFILKAPTKEGYTFEGWYTTPSFKTRISKIETGDCKNIKIYAKWKKDLVKPTPSTTPTPDISSDKKLLPGPKLEAEYRVSWSVGQKLLMHCVSEGYEGLGYVFEISYDGVNFEQLPQSYWKDDPWYTHEISNPDVDTIDTCYVRARQTGETTINGIVYNGTKYSNIVEVFIGSPSMDISSEMLRDKNEYGSYNIPIGSEVQFYTKSKSEHAVWGVTEVPYGTNPDADSVREEIIESGHKAFEGCTISDSGLLKINNDPHLIGKTLLVSTHLPYDVDPLNEGIPYDAKVIELTARTEEDPSDSKEPLDPDLPTKKMMDMKVQPGSLKLYVGGMSKGLKVSNAKGKVTYKSSDTSVARVSNTGTVTPVSKGNTTITIQATGNSSYRAATKKIKVTVYGKLRKINSVKVTPSRSKGAVNISWGRSYQAFGYIVRYSYRKDMAGSKNIRVDGRDVCDRTLKKLKSKKYVYIQVQAYIKDGKKLVKGSWSRVTRSKGKIR